MARRNCHTTSQAAVQRVRQAIEEAREEPIHRYVFPISQPRLERPSPLSGESSAALIQVLEQLQCQNQLLVDLLGAVNALTAAVLCRKE